MMQAGVISGTLRSQFSSRTEVEIFRRFQREQSDRRKRNDRENEDRNDTADLVDVAMLIVTEAEVGKLRMQIDRYDVATIEALYKNGTALELILKQQEELLTRAYVLPDGRRVFKSKDGTVFDEHGEELDIETVDPYAIGDHRPSWESYKFLKEQRETLEHERQELLAYQEKLDEAREHLDAGDMTRDEFDRLRDDLTEQMPDAVRARLPELANTTPEAPSQETALTFEDDMVPTYTPPGMAPGFAG